MLSESEASRLLTSARRDLLAAPPERYCDKVSYQRELGRLTRTTINGKRQMLAIEEPSAVNAR
jgi:hypothetical protein